MTDECTLEQPQEQQLETWHYFPSAVYSVKKPEFLDVVKEVSAEYVDKWLADNKVDEIYPIVQTGSYFDDPRMADFSRFVGETCWNILSSQGYFMNDKNVFFTEMWTQQHYKHSLMEQHVHGYGSQLVGFYFLECPENCSRVVVHDPRPGKVQTNLPETDQSQATYGSNMINFVPEPGTLMIANSWLPHSFGRHASEEPFKFVHFNVAVEMAPPAQLCQAPAEVV